MCRTSLAEPSCVSRAAESIRIGASSGPAAFFSAGFGAAAAGASATSALSAFCVALPPGTHKPSEASAPEAMASA